MQNQEEPSLEKPSLYDRLGGVYNIATVADDLIDRVMVASMKRIIAYRRRASSIS
jgi:hypothetical protein